MCARPVEILIGHKAALAFVLELFIGVRCKFFGKSNRHYKASFRLFFEKRFSDQLVFIRFAFSERWGRSVCTLDRESVAHVGERFQQLVRLCFEAVEVGSVQHVQQLGRVFLIACHKLTAFKSLLPCVKGFFPVGGGLLRSRASRSLTI